MITNTIVAIVTAYCSCTDVCCPKSSKGLTANGTRPVQGVTVAASRKYPLGSKVIINGKQYTVQDRLHRKFDARFDVYFNRHKDARAFGIQTNKVTVITK